VVKETIDLPTLIVDTVELFNINAREAHLSINIDTSDISFNKEWHGYPGYFSQVKLLKHHLVFLYAHCLF
jgi:hypothetical protein